MELVFFFLVDIKWIWRVIEGEGELGRRED